MEETMNTKNNKRRRDSQDKIETAFMELIKKKELNRITVAEICKLAPCNRSTFYANYDDVFALADSVRHKLEEHYNSIFIAQGEASDNYLLLFRHIKENMELYKLYFKLGFDKEYRIFRYDETIAKEQFGEDKLIPYHCEFFRGGITMIIKMWLERDCQETPEEMYKVIVDEYRGRV